MKPIRYVFPGLCSLALVNGPMLNALASGVPDESWQIVPEETLSDLRGGLDLGPLIGSFAIQRVVEVNGEVVARMQIVISNLNRLGQGGMPTIAISGPLAELVQVFNPAGVSASASLPTNSSSTVRTTPTSSVAPASPPANSAATPATASTNNPAPQSSTRAGSSPGSAATVATNNGPHIGSTSGNTGTTSATGTQTGSTAQFGAAISQAVAAANGATSANAAAPAAAAPSAARASASQTSTAPVASTTAAAAASTAAAASAANPAQSFTQTIPVGNTGNVIVVSNIPNATAISSEVQNSVQATRVQTLTTITATLNSLQLLNAAAIANAVRQQIASGH